MSFSLTGSQSLVFLYRELRKNRSFRCTLDVLDFRMNFCLHLTSPKPVSAIYYDINLMFTVNSRCNPVFLFTEHVDVSKRLLTLFLIISTSDRTDLICLHFSVHSVHLYYLFPSLEEGGLATYRTAIVQNQHLAMLAKVNPPPARNECAGQSSGRSAS